MRPVTEIAAEMGIPSDLVSSYGLHKAKISTDAIRTTGHRGKMVVVTGITPTRAGEGKTTTTVGLTQGLGKLGRRVIATLREPALGPIFGIKGGGTGGGKSRVLPEEEINIHFTGDSHAVSSAHNLLATLADNMVQRGQIPNMSPDGLTWRRVTDVEDRALRSVVVGIGGSANAPMYQTGFDIVTASEIMATLALSSDLDDLRGRLERIVVGFDKNDMPITAKDVRAVGSMMALLRQAIHPNLVQTTEGQPVIVHTGPFGNIAHGCSSVIADRLALGYADLVLTEAGFGADLGFEKFMHIKARYHDLEPHAAVLVASARALKSHGGVADRSLDEPNPGAVAEGIANLEHLIGVIRSFGLPVVVAINRFPSDTSEEINLIKERSNEVGAYAAVESRVFEEGGEGGLELAEALISATDLGAAPQISYLYPEEATTEEKALALAKKVYGADSVSWSPAARNKLKKYDQLGWNNLPLCMAKTPLSLSHNPSLKGKPNGYTFEIADVKVALGPGFVYPIAGNIVLMPGLPGTPRALDVDEGGNVSGM